MRKSNFKQGFREMKVKLKAISGGNLGLAEQLNESVALLNGFYREVSDVVRVHVFPEKEDEVYFFKFEKPEFYSLRVFHLSLYALLKQLPVGGPDVLRDYYLEELRFIARFFQRHAFHYEYYRSGFTELDELLFLRGVEVQAALVGDLGDFDPDFCTAGDGLFAQFMGFELLQEYIMERLGELDQADLSRAGSRAGQAVGTGPRFPWTGEVVNLVELGYGLYLSRQIGGGKTTLVEIFKWLEESFGVEIENPAMRFRDVKRRKRLSRTHFMDLVRDALIRYMDEEFE